ncbi:MAG: hypothetical protein DCC55_01270 [Chloroflexi bacterium]|nr:MAG: hypothetical protein DCC55_01270 [Chloroflexota bacterium]
MDALFAQLLAQLDFFATGFGVLTTAALAASIFLFWEWRTALVALLVVQTGVATLMVTVHELPTQWAAVQILVILLCALLLSLSAQQMRGRQATRAPGPWPLRLMVLLLLLASWRVFDLQLSIPLLNPPVIRLFLWLGLCALTTLALSDSPFFTGVALLLWCAPIQSIVELLVPGHNLFVIIGMVEIVVTLACSYLLLIDLTPEPKPAPVITDSTYIERVPALPALPAPERPLLPDPGAVRPQPPRPTGPAPDAPAVVRGSQ